MREARGLSLQAVAERLDVSPQAVHQFEKSEAAGTISLRQLGNVAAAMGCRLSYSLTPRGGVIAAAAPAVEAAHPPETPALAEAGTKAVEHSMFLQNQAEGRFD